MADRKPLVLIDGIPQGLPSGDALSKADVSLGNVDNTSDANKPVSSATQTALNGKADISSGSWTAILDFASGQSGSFAYSNQTGYYIKIGNLVHVQIWIEWTAKPSAGSTLRISGLPFNQISSSNYRGSGSLGYFSGAWSKSPTIIFNENANDIMYIFGDGLFSFSASDIPASGNLMITCNYIT